MTWMLTASGAEYHLAGPTSLAACGRPVKIEDVAHHLAIVAQFNGATSRPYSVAEHSLLCADIARRAGASVFVEMAALMHDAHEAYTNDLISPAKLAVNSLSMGAGGVAAWGLFEAEHAKTVREHFKLLSVFAEHRTLLRSIDSQALATARRDICRGRFWATTRCNPWHPPIGFVSTHPSEKQQRGRTGVSSFAIAFSSCRCSAPSQDWRRPMPTQPFVIH